MVDESRTFSVDSCCHTCLAQVLTGKTSNEKFHLGGKVAKLGYVGTAVDFGEMPCQYCACSRGDFAQQRRIVPTPAKPDLKPAYAREKPCDFHNLKTLCLGYLSTHCLVAHISAFRQILDRP